MTQRSRRKPRRTQLERRNETQAAILSTSIRLLAKHGYAGFSASRVAAEAGVSRGALEHYFPKRGDLIAAATRYAMREAVEHARSLAQSATRSKDPIENFLSDSEHVHHVLRDALDDHAPVCIGAFAAANIAGVRPMRTGWTAIRFGWVAFVVPFLFVFSPTMLMAGDPLWIAVDFMAATVGVWFISVSVMGYSIRRLDALSRGAYGVAGFCLLLPLQTFGGGHWVNGAGALMAIAILVWEYGTKRGENAIRTPTARER